MDVGELLKDQGRLNRYALKITGDSVAAQDLVQSVLLKLLLMPQDRYEERGQIFTFAYRVMYCMWIDMKRWRSKALLQFANNSGVHNNKYEYELGNCDYEEQKRKVVIQEGSYEMRIGGLEDNIEDEIFLRLQSLSNLERDILDLHIEGVNARDIGRLKEVSHSEIEGIIAEAIRKMKGENEAEEGEERMGVVGANTIRKKSRKKGGLS